MERWDLDARASYNLRPYVGLRMPMVEPLGEARDVRWMFPELAKRIAGGMEDWYKETQEEYMEQWASNVPLNPETGKSGLARLMEEGCWENTSIEPFYEPHLQPLSDDDLAGSSTDPATQIITKDGVGIGIMIDGKAVRGFKTPSRKFEVRSVFLSQTGLNQDTSELIKLSAMTKTLSRPEQHKSFDVVINEMPIWLQPEEHQDMSDEHLIMTSFKWNVHNHGRTMNLKWLAEIVHSNPAWLNPLTAKKFGLQDGDWIELTGYFSKMLEKTNPNLVNENYEKDADGRLIAGRMRVPIVTMPGIHPRAIAMSNSCGHWEYTSVAQAKKASTSVGMADGPVAAGSDAVTYRDPDWERNMWWEDDSNGDHSKWKQNTGNGWNQNRILPIAPDPVTGQQAFHSTVVSLKKI
jgi:anaerobic selenocysteine-containing dehydrogenase